jgi:CheY-like chemotaxis protein
VNTKPILYAEDEVDDVFFMRRAFQKTGLMNPLISVSDGQEAMDYLSGVGKYADRQQYPMPCLVLLDLNMPIRNGLEVLKWIRGQEMFRTLLIVVLTSSSLDRDIDVAYKLGANAYLVKPPTPDKLAEMAGALQDFWLRMNQEPPECVKFGED